jgi:hypothetical protein
VTTLKFLCYFCHDTLDISQYIIVPKSDNMVASSFNPVSSLRIHVVNICLSALAAIKFDNQFLIRTNEVNNIIANGLLPSEFPAIEL